MRLSRTTVFLVGLATISLAACSSGGGDSSASDAGAGAPGDLTEVTVSVTHPEDLYGLPWEVGQAQGFFENAGVKVTQIIPSEGGGTTLQNVVSGRLPFGEVATGAIVSGAQEGAPIQVIGGGVQSVSDVLWVALKDSPLKSLEDAQDASWGFTNPGSVTEAMSYLTPEGLGWDTKALDRKSTGGTGAGIALLEAGDVDVTYASPRVAKEKGDALKVLGSSADYVPAYQQTMIVSSRDYASKHPEVARGLLKGYEQSIEWINANPEDAAALWADLSDLDSGDALGLLKSALEADYWGLAYNPDALKAAGDALAYTDGIKAVQWSDLLTDEYLPEGQKGQIP